MRFSHFFIQRPIFAAVISIVIAIAGLISLRILPLSEYPDIVPPTIAVTAAYPGANPETIAETVAAPLEQAINGVPNMMYLASTSTADGRLTIVVTFELGTDLDIAQVQVQNRVAAAEARLPEDVRRLGVTVTERAPSQLMLVNLVAPSGEYDRLYLSNYAAINLRDRISRLEGVGEVFINGSSSYAMRVWLDPEQLGERGLTADDVLAALRRQNVQVAAGAVGAQPDATEANLQMTIETEGRLTTPERFETVVVSRAADGGVVRLGDVARVEIGAENYDTDARIGGEQTIAMLVFQRPGSNALATARGVIESLDEASAEFPPGFEYRVSYNTTEFVAESIRKVGETMIEAVILVVIVVFLFLQSFRAALIPVLAIPVSILGSFALLAGLGGSINTISMFGLILAIGIVVDDAIVVVENVERNLAAGLSPKEAARRTMDEVGGALIAIALVLIAVFAPVAFIGGLAGEFYRQFALTIATATAISCLVSLTLSPALAAAFLRSHAERREPPRFVGRFFKAFNASFDWLGARYGQLARRAVRYSLIVCVLYGGLVAATAATYAAAPKGFVPQMDRGFALVAVQLPAGATLDRTRAVVDQVRTRISRVEGYATDSTVIGFSGATDTNAPNSASVFVLFDPFDERHGAEMGASAIAERLQAAVAPIEEARVLVIEPAAVDGVGSGAGLTMMIQDRAGHGYAALAEAVSAMSMAAMAAPGVGSAFSLFEAETPRLKVEVDVDQAEALNVPVDSINRALEVFMGSAYVNDFNYLGRTFRVTAQADASFRDEPSDIGRLAVRSLDGDMIPLSALTRVAETAGPGRAPRYNLFPAAELNVEPAPGTSTGQLITTMEALARDTLPEGFDYEWTALGYIETQESGGAIGVFLIAALFVLLVLAAQYESVSLPIAVVLVAPMAVLGALIGVLVVGLDVSILTQVAFVILVGLAAKNAILIVEFARQLEQHEGLDRFSAAAKAAGIRLRPILMTSLAFILGVMPLVFASGAGAEQRFALGVAVFFGMIGVTLIGLVLTPVFYVVMRGLADRLDRRFSRRSPDARSERPAE